MKTSYLIIGGVVLAAGAYLYANRDKRPAGTAAATATSSSSTSTTTKSPSFWDRALGAVGAGLSSYSQSGTVARTSSTAAVMPLDLGDLDLVDTQIA